MADIVKQFYYEKAVRLIEEGCEIYNWFVFPGSEQHFDKITMEAGERNYDDAFSPVHCLYVEPEKVMDAYLKRKKEFSVRDFVIPAKA